MTSDHQVLIFGGGAAGVCDDLLPVLRVCDNIAGLLALSKGVTL
jgi:hypothetical protein